jgi:hypothetical protein
VAAALYLPADDDTSTSTDSRLSFLYSELENHLFGNCATNRGQRFTPEDAIRLHTPSREWLAAMVAEPFDGRTVVVTHHAPSSQSVDPRCASDLLTPVFASNLENLMDGDRAALWVPGHMHESYDYESYGSRLVCNPRGYVPDARNPDFRPG